MDVSQSFTSIHRTLDTEDLKSFIQNRLTGMGHFEQARQMVPNTDDIRV
jgi:hypothetical protein